MEQRWDDCGGSARVSVLYLRGVSRGRGKTAIAVRFCARQLKARLSRPRRHDWRQEKAKGRRRLSEDIGGGHPGKADDRQKDGAAVKKGRYAELGNRRGLRGREWRYRDPHKKRRNYPFTWKTILRDKVV